MRLGIDAREIENGVCTGTGRSLMQFLNVFLDGMHRDKCVLFSSKPLPMSFDGAVTNRVVEPTAVLWWDQVLLPAAISREHIEIFYSPYYKIPLAASCRKVASVMDLRYLKYEEYARRLTRIDRAYYMSFGRRMVNSADRVITCSDFSRQDIISSYKTDPRKITVVPLAVSSLYRPQEDAEVLGRVKAGFGIRGRYLLYNGTFRKHQNIPVLLSMMGLLAAEMPDLTLVLAAPHEAEFRRLAGMAAYAGLTDRVIFAGAVPDEDVLRSLYSGAEAFLFPSLYEGFGRPPLEAMACGAPVVAANATCLPETLAGAAILVDPLEPRAYADAVRRIIGEKAVRDDLRSRGFRRAGNIREERYARRLHDVLRSVAGYT